MKIANPHTALKRRFKALKSSTGRLSNLYVYLLIKYQKKKKKKRRIATILDQYIMGIDKGTRNFKICLVTEGQYLRKKEKISGWAWRGIHMPVARLIMYLYKKCITRHLQQLKRLVQKRKKNNIADSNTIYAGIFNGMGYKFINSKQIGGYECDYYDQITNEARKSIRLFKSISSNDEEVGRIGVLISCYKPEKYIKNFLDNLNSMEYKNRIVPIFINASMTSDCKKLIIKQVRNAFEDFLFLDRPKSGIYNAWNEGVKAIGSKVEFLTNFNVDDKRHPLTFAIQAEYLKAFKHKNVVTTDYIYFFRDHKSLKEMFNRYSENATKIPTINSRTLLDRNFPHSGPMWRRRLHDADDCDLFDENYKSAGDAEFWYRVSRKHESGFGIISIPLSLYYQNPNGLSTRPETIGASEHEKASIDHYLYLKEQMLNSIDPSFAKEFLVASKTEELQIHAMSKILGTTK